MLLEYYQSLKSFYPFFSEKRRVEFKITLINSEVSRNFFFFISYIISKPNDRIEKMYWQNMSILTSSIQRHFLFFDLTHFSLTFHFSPLDNTFTDFRA